MEFVIYFNRTSFSCDAKMNCRLTPSVGVCMRRLASVSAARVFVCMHFVWACGYVVEERRLLTGPVREPMHFCEEHPYMGLYVGVDMLMCVV